MSGQQATAVKVTADVDFGVKGAVEVFPSQNYIDGKLKGFPRSLYKYGVPNRISKTDNNRVGYAAIRDQKIGNAIRTIDTWYPEFKETGVPIAIEPNGANLDTQRFFRKNSTSAFMMFLQLNDIDPNTEQGMFCIASLVRGGVYSGGKDGKGEE
jgi:CRISPR-associated protein Csy3